MLTVQAAYFQLPEESVSPMYEAHTGEFHAFIHQEILQY